MYSDPESPAGVLRSAQPGEEIKLDLDDPAQPLRCHTGQFQFSAHASREALIDYGKKLSPKKIVLVHSDPPAVESMRRS
jgi:Cft2 family RNA processing exonuclease